MDNAIENLLKDMEELRKRILSIILPNAKENDLLWLVTSIEQDINKLEQPQDDWIPVSERLPEGKTDSHTNDFEIVLCTTIWEDVRPYKFGKPIGHEKSHFWHIGEIMDEYVIAWQPLPEPYKKGDTE